MIEISKPPNLKIFGFFLKSIMVDSNPTEDVPPSRTNLIFFPKSSLTSEELTALTLDEILALGAARGYSNPFSNFLVT